MVKYFIGQNTLATDLEGDVSVESDCEGDIQGLGEEIQRVEDKEELVRAVFITGSFSAYVAFHRAFFPEKNDRLSSWKSLFFYRCTDKILFAPLKSQGIDSRSKYIRENTIREAPPPCSPRNIYFLARLVRQPLTKYLESDTNALILAGNQAPLQRCPSRHQKQSDLTQR